MDLQGEIGSQGVYEEAAQPTAEDDARARAATKVRPAGTDTGLKDAAAAAEDTCDDSRDGDAPKGTASRTAPVASRVGVLFSGGLDSVVLAAMLAEEGDGRRPAVPKGEAIDLINVCFDRWGRQLSQALRL